MFLRVFEWVFHILLILFVRLPQYTSCQLRFPERRMNFEFYSFSIFCFRSPQVLGFRFFSGWFWGSWVVTTPFFILANYLGEGGGDFKIRWQHHIWANIIIFDHIYIRIYNMCIYILIIYTLNLPFTLTYKKNRTNKFIHLSYFIMSILGYTSVFIIYHLDSPM